MIEFDTIIVSTALSIVVAFGVGLYIRYYTKPKHEEIFEHNRKDSLRMIFGFLHNLDLTFESYVVTFEENMGEINNDKNRILSEQEWGKNPHRGKSSSFFTVLGSNPTYPRVIRQLEEEVSYIKKYHEEFKENYNLFQNYIHADFLRKVDTYMRHTYAFTVLVHDEGTDGNLFTSRMNYAKKIIDYVEADKIVDTTSPPIVHFINRWKKEFQKFPDLIEQ